MAEDENKTIWCGNLAEQVTEELLYELFLQAGPLERVKIPKDRDGRNRNFGFITYRHEVSVPYAISLFRGTALFHKTLQLQVRGRTAPLLPPIRCSGPEAVDMTERLNVGDPNLVSPSLARDYDQAHEANDNLVMASLQGNWSHRHHTYRAKETGHNRDDYRHRDGAYNAKSNSNSWKRKQDNRSRRK